MTTMPTQTPPARGRNKYFLYLAAMVAALGLLAYRDRPDGRLHVILFATKGDAALIQTPSGRYILIDGGGDPAALASALGKRLPFWRRTLDAVVLTSSGRSHLPGQVAALTRYRADVAIAAPTTYRSATLTEWLRLLDQQNTPVEIATSGARFQIDGVTLTVLATGDGDESGMMLRLDYGATSVVFDQAGDEGDEEQLAAAGDLRPATLVVFPWQRSPHTEFIARLAPRAMVLTDGFESDKPLEETMAERALGGARLYHEQLAGEIEWVSDGRAASVITTE